MRAEDIRIERHHEVDCHSLQSAAMPGGKPRWLHWWINGETVQRDAIGRRCRTAAGGQRWIVFKCNSVNCEARVVVKETALLFECAGALVAVPVMKP